MRYATGLSKTDKAREILISQSPSVDYESVITQTGLAMSSLTVLVSRMRRDGLLPKLGKKRYEYTATHIQTSNVVKFKSLYSAEKSGFTAACIRSMFNSGRDEYCGYRWERKEIVSQ